MLCQFGAEIDLCSKECLQVLEEVSQSLVGELI